MTEPALFPRTSDAFRTDLQALRGVAVLVVLLHHAQAGEWFGLGYLGVDVFFVLSGYLVTGIVKRDLERGTFSLSAFYLRRAKRLLPAAFVVFGACLGIAPFFLPQSELQDFMRQLAGALTFTANIALWMQTGYFETEAALKPLLHVWSLSIEEQYYLLLPLALLVAPRRYWIRGAATIVTLSLFLWLVMTPSKPGAAFYLLPTRAWELAIGSVGALAFDRASGSIWARKYLWVAVILLVVIPIIGPASWQGSPVNLLICLATLVVILAKSPVLQQALPIRALARIGDISYSLYLVHWPLFAFANNAYVSPVPGSTRAGLLCASFVLAFLLYHYVEQPIRKMELPTVGRGAAILSAGSLGVVGLAFAVAFTPAYSSGVDFVAQRRGNVGLSGSCEFGDSFSPIPACRTADAPRILVWGDSNAMHLVPGIQATTDAGLVQATKTVCGPLLGISAIPRSSQYKRDWPQECINFNWSVLEYLARTPSIQVVVLASLYSQYMPGNRLLMQSASGRLDQVEGDPAIALEGLRRTVASIHSLGRKVVAVAPPPGSGFDLGRCLELQTTGRWVFGADFDSCDISVSKYQSMRKPVLDLMNRISKDLNIDVIRFEPTPCGPARCLAILDETFVYRDAAHLSYDGSRVVARNMQLGSRLVAQAR
jgi:peptidoglycan/LPS O-acetylase OafA/YrhL